MRFTVMSWFVVLLLIVGVAASATRFRTVRWGFVLTGITALVVLAVLAVAVQPTRTTRSVTREAQHRIPVVELPQPPDPRSITTGSAWHAVVDNEFEADIYPSARTAARALARKLLPLLVNVTPDQKDPTIIQISGTQLVDEQLVLGDAAEVLRQNLDEVRVLVESVTPASSIELTDAGAIAVQIDLPNRTTRRQAPWDPERSQVSGPLRAQVRGRSSEFTTTTRFIDKPWVEAFGAFVSSHPSRQWIVGQSAQFANGQHDAEQQAILAAAEQLAAKIEPMVDLATTDRPLINVDTRTRPSIVNELVTAMQSGQFIVDRFVQRLSRPYGDVWREAVLIDATDIDLGQFSRNHIARTVRVRNRQIGSGFSMVALVAFICLVYAFLNIASKGYYRWSLRFAMIVLAVAGVAMLLMVA